MKKLPIVILLLTSIAVFSQNITKEDLTKEIKPILEKIKALESENIRLKSNVIIIKAKLDSLQEQSVANSKAIIQTGNELTIKINETENKSEGKIAKISESLSKKTLWGIIGVLLAFLLSGGLYRLVSKRQRTDKSDIIEQLSKTKSTIEESLVNEFRKQTEILDSQLHLIEQQKTSLQLKSNAEPDHSLALKVADEITLIGRNISLMDKNVKGIKQLLRSVQKLKDNLSANGYDIPDLLDKQFNEGMKLIVVNSVPDENLQKGDEVISKIIKPQVNYNNKMIQPAQVEVSVG